MPQTRVIVTLKPATGSSIAQAQNTVIKALKKHRYTVTRKYQSLPQMALSVDAKALAVLKAHPLVVQVAEDGLSAPQGLSKPN